jgi:hydroxyacylglutathione hydrolase
MLEVVQLPVLQDNYIYLVHNNETKETAVIDPALAAPVLEELEKRSWQLHYILNTHHHGDHVGGNKKLHQKTGAEIIGYTDDQHRIPGISTTVNNNDCICICGYNVDVLFTPGHTLGHIVFHFTEQNWLFCGDTLFSMGCGRLFEGTAKQMFSSLQRIKKLPEQTQIYCAHEYTLSNGEFSLHIHPENTAIKDRVNEVKQLREKGLATIPTRLSIEKQTNPFLLAQSAAEFTTIRKEKDKF